MSKLRIAICTERLLPRYGVDRMLIMLAEHLQTVSIVDLYYVRADQDSLKNLPVKREQIEIDPRLGILEAEIVAQDRCRSLWIQNTPDVVVCGGWPFLSLAHLAAELNVRSIFLDAGAVHHDGMSESEASGQRQLRSIRQSTLPAFDTILAISDFIKTSQSIPDRGSSRGVKTVLLGCDHFLRSYRVEDDTRLEQTALQPQQIFNKKRDAPIDILLLGRFERDNYKNSAAAFHLLANLKIDFPDINLIILGGRQHIELPAQVSRNVTVLRSVSDAQLRSIMKGCVLGISMSLWEGFNLPLVEMQSLSVPALAFAVGAHAEVIAHPWFLCASQTEMA